MWINARTKEQQGAKDEKYKIKKRVQIRFVIQQRAPVSSRGFAFGWGVSFPPPSHPPSARGGRNFKTHLSAAGLLHQRREQASNEAACKKFEG